MVAQLIEKHGLDVDADTEDLRDFFHNTLGSGTPIDSAVDYKNLPVLQELLRRGAKPNVHGAAYVAMRDGPSGFLPAFKLFLDAGVDFTAALSFAARFDYHEAVTICLEYGANVANVIEKDDVQVQENAGNPDFDPEDPEPEIRTMSQEMRRTLESFLRKNPLATP